MKIFLVLSSILIAQLVLCQTNHFVLNSASGISENSDIYIDYSIGELFVVETTSQYMVTEGILQAVIIGPSNTNDDHKNCHITPNPTLGYLQLPSEFSSGYKLEIISIQGQRRLSIITESTTIDISELNSGLYILALYDQNLNVVLTNKIIKI